MAEFVLRKAAQAPEKDALCVLFATHVERWSYGDIETAVRGIATGFLQQGLVKGERVLLRMGNSPLTPLAYLGAIAVGLIPVPTSPQLTQGEVETIIAELEPKLIVKEDGIACPAHPAALDARALNDFWSLPPAAYDRGDPDRAAYIVYTSGTSGRPRAVEHAHRAIWARQMMDSGWYDLRETDRVLHAGAFNWTYTMGTGLMDPWRAGATALIPAPNTSPVELPQLIDQHAATIFAAAPGVYRKMLAGASRAFGTHLRHGLSAGEKLGDKTRKDWENATQTQVYEAYGLSECSTFISANPKAPAMSGALGTPQSGRRIALLGADGAPCALGETGEIAVHTSDPGLMRGYVNAAEETAQRFAKEWFLTGDLGVMDHAGQITYAGRNDDQMNAGGYRVSPIEVEQALADLPGIETIAVTDITVKEDTKVIMAFYTAQAALDPEDCHAYATARLAAYKLPRAYIHVPEMPTGPNGKLKRKAFQEIWRQTID